MNEYIKTDTLSRKKMVKIGEGSLKLKQLNRLFLIHKTFFGGKGGPRDFINILEQSIFYFSYCYFYTVDFFMSHILLGI